MIANNELGNIYPIKEIGKIAKENNLIIKVNDYVIIPLYHPEAQIKKEKQLEH